MISIIIPVLNEAEHIQSVLEAVLLAAGNQPYEIIIADGGSTDGTLNRVEQFKAQKKTPMKNIAVHIVMSQKGRARQMNAGAMQVSGDWLLFLHADSILPKNSLVKIANAKTGWGRFDVRLSSSKLWAQMISFMINRRSRVTGIATGDQAIFIKRELFDAVKGFPNQPLMEDVELCKRLLTANQKPTLLRQKVMTSSRRWEKHGVLKTIILMWSLRWQYARGVSADELYKQYYGSQ